MVESLWPVYKSREMTSMDRRCGVAEYHRLSNSIYAVRSTEHVYRNSQMYVNGI